MKALQPGADASDRIERYHGHAAATSGHPLGRYPSVDLLAEPPSDQNSCDHTETVDGRVGDA